MFRQARGVQSGFTLQVDFCLMGKPSPGFKLLEAGRQQALAKRGIEENNVKRLARWPGFQNTQGGCLLHFSTSGLQSIEIRP